MKTVIFKVKNGKLDQWKEWCSKLNISLRMEAIQTLKEENLTLEGCFLFKIIDEYYIFSVSDSDGEVLPALDSDINNTHKLMKSECLDKIEGGRGEELYFLKI